MANKGGGKRHEMDFGDKRIDIRRFAYDVIKYSALKFGVPENCIDKWKGSSKNDYGCPDFCSALFRVVIDYQIMLRSKLNTCFTKNYQSNELKSYALILSTLREAIISCTSYPLFSIADDEISLCILCELVVFLHSKKLNLPLQELANWFAKYLLAVQGKFEKAGGLRAMYLRGIEPERCVDDAFYEKFISVYCIPYEDSAKIQNIDRTFTILLNCYNDMLEKNFLKSQRKKTDDIFVRESLNEDGLKEYEIVMLPVTSEQNEDSGNDISEKGDIDMAKFIEFYKTDEGALFIDETVSYLFRGATSQNQPQNSTVASAQKK